MERLWTPWRMKYISDEGEANGCPFCTDLGDAGSFNSLVVYVGRSQYVVMNLYPYNTGHLLIIPKSHVASIEDLTPAERAEMFELADLSIEAVRSALNADGFNLGMNIGPVSGAGIAEHAHLHVVPRWFGDTNFMPMLANTKVLPELLHVTRAKIMAEIDSIVNRRDQALRTAAGAIVYDKDLATIVMRKTANGEIVIPKGKIEDGESAAGAATRELHEETGYHIEIAGWAGRETIEVTPEYRLATVYFLASGMPGTSTAEHLNTDTVLVPVNEARESLTFRGQQTILDEVLALLPGI